MTQQSPDVTTQQTQDDEPVGQMVPVTESIRYRKRAQQAEQELAAAGEQLQAERDARAGIESELHQARSRLELTRSLAGRGVIDLDAAVLLAESRLANAGDDASEADVIEQLLGDKPYLLAGNGPAADHNRPLLVATMPTPTQGRRTEGSAGVELLRQARNAAASGKPADLDRYLKMRRRMR